MVEGAKFACESCGRQYPWKPEFAGKRAKCKCGQVLTVPASLPEVGAQDLFDLVPEPGSAPAPKPQPAARTAPPLGGARHTAAKGAAAATVRCPSCQAELAPGMALCMSCGFNLKTGQHVQTQVVGQADDDDDAPATTPLPPLPGRRPPKGKTREEAARAAGDSARVIKGIVVIAIVALVVVGVVFGAKIYFKRTGGGSAGNTGPMLADDAEAMRMLREAEPIEGREFLNANDARNLGPTLTNRQSKGKVDRWYELGAVKVWAFNGLTSAHIVLELPQDAAKRKGLFDWSAQWEKEKMQPIPKDVGQKYIILHML
jgi:hypothetical protein